MLQLSQVSKTTTQLPIKKANGRNLVSIDADLLKRIADDDVAAFEEFYRLTEQTVYAFVLSILKNPHDAQDIMQDTYIKIRSAAHLYKDQGKPLAWVFTIARNLCLMRIRTGKRESDTTIDDLTDSEYLATSDSGSSEDRIVLDAALTILGEEERQIVILHAISGLKHREISKLLELPLSTVLSKYNRSLKKLKKHLIEREM